MRSLSERSELRRSWMGGAAAPSSGVAPRNLSADTYGIAKCACSTLAVVRRRPPSQPSPTRGEGAHSVRPYCYGLLLRCVRRQRERVHRAGEFLGQHLIHRALALDARLAGEGAGDDLHAEMRLAALAPAGVTVVLVGLVGHGQRFRLECHAQFAFDPLRHLAHIMPPGKSNTIVRHDLAAGGPSVQVSS